MNIIWSKIWTQPENIDSDGNADQDSSYYFYETELGLYYTVVMTTDVYLHLFKTDYYAFSDNLWELFQQEVTNKYPLMNEGNCVLHIDLTEDHKTAIVSIQHSTDYYFFVKDHRIPLKA